MGGVESYIDETGLKPKEIIIKDMFGSWLKRNQIKVVKSRWVNGGILIEFDRPDDDGNYRAYIRNARYTSPNWWGQRRIRYNDNPLDDEDIERCGIKFYK